MFLTDLFKKPGLCNAEYYMKYLQKKKVRYTWDKKNLSVDTVFEFSSGRSLSISAMFRDYGKGKAAVDFVIFDLAKVSSNYDEACRKVAELNRDSMFAKYYLTDDDHSMMEAEMEFVMPKGNIGSVCYESLFAFLGEIQSLAKNDSVRIQWE